jgi:hypothetical protein
MAKEPKATEFNNFFVKIVEACAGFCLACILTLTFISPLTPCQKAAMCFFVVAFVSFIRQAVVSAGHISNVWTRRKLNLDIEFTFFTLGIFVMLVAFAFMLWGASHFAAVVYVIAAIISIMAESHWSAPPRKVKSATDVTVAQPAPAQSLSDIPPAQVKDGLPPAAPPP